MAEASPLLLTVTPKQLGKHLRDVRRKKGLSLSEVARGAGLSRRELVNYERGKVPIPESDLWVLAGSCGVDASELVPHTAVPELPAAPTSMGDTVAQLRRTQNDASLAPYLATLNRLQALPPGKRVPVKERELEEIATALGREPDAIENRLRQVMHLSPTDATRLREIILPTVGGRHRPRAIEPAPQFTEMAAEVPGSVDVFEELARLPEPLPLPDPDGPAPDMFATPPPPDGAIELVDRASVPVEVGAAAFGAGNGVPTGLSTPMFADHAAAASASGADAPPIDVALRESSDGWADWGKVPSSAPLGERGSPPATPIVPEAAGWAPTPSDAPTWEPPPWQPTGPDGESLPDGPPSFWEGTDDWTPPVEVGDATADVPADFTTDFASDPWTSNEWPSDLSGEQAPDGGEQPAPAYDAAYDVGFDLPIQSTGTAGPLEWSTDQADPWAHEPDPEAVSTGFYVDWGDPDSSDEPPAWHALIGTEPGTERVEDEHADVAYGEVLYRDEPTDTVDIDISDEPTHTIEVDTDVDSDVDDALPPILWRAEALTAASPEVEPDPDPIFDPPSIPDDDSTGRPEQFVAAGSDWQLGNALPLVEVRAQGTLVMRRADERWALADITTPPDCAVEVDVDFRSGPGLGVLFRADVDAEGRMSGYSFDIDPIYDGGGYLVRQWQADRELWNPIARVGALDPDSMYGPLTVRLVLQGDHLAAQVNGVEVLTVESLKQASADRGREAADGNRVGVQAWSSSDLVIETLRVAER
jgi:transcriptional regulator with XRE-family HTH domain